MTWVDVSTGEILSRERDTQFEKGRAEWLEEVPEAPPSWEPDWLAKQLLHADAEEKALRKQFDRLLRQVAARRRYLVWAYQPTVEAIVREELVGSRKKSVDYPHGRIGFRTSRRVEVDDEGKALAWAREHCVAAIKVRTSLLKSALPKGDVPGVRRVCEEVFYVTPAGGGK